MLLTVQVLTKIQLISFRLLVPCVMFPDIARNATKTLSLMKKKRRGCEMQYII